MVTGSRSHRPTIVVATLDPRHRRGGNKACAKKAESDEIYALDTTRMYYRRHEAPMGRTTKPFITRAHVKKKKGKKKGFEIDRY